MDFQNNQWPSCFFFWPPGQVTTTLVALTEITNFKKLQLFTEFPFIRVSNLTFVERRK
jgi:hypothetical protein